MFSLVRYGPLWPCSLRGRSRARVLDIPPRHFLADFKDSAYSEAPQMGTGSRFASEARRARWRARPSRVGSPLLDRHPVRPAGAGLVRAPRWGLKRGRSTPTRTTARRSGAPTGASGSDMRSVLGCFLLWP